MSLEEEIQKHSNGARFYRADLHIHTFGENGSYDVTDPKMNPENIVKIAKNEKISVISIADHNAIGNVEKAIAAGKENGVLVIPGVELTTPQGHLLVYFETYEFLKNFYNKLTISNDKKTCEQTISQCLSIASQFNGFGVLAHVELDNGFEKRANGVFKENIILDPNLLGIEISSINSVTWYSPEDENDNRKAIFNKRKSQLGFEDDASYLLTKVMSSDSHNSNQLFKNASGAKKLTRVKMDSLTFHGLKVALMDMSARVRLEDQIPESIPHFVGIKVEGGFLDGQVANFSKNLTCIIGGRGAGKSTFMESVRCSSGNTPASSVVDSEVFPDKISLLFEDEAGQRSTLVREKLGTAYNIDDEEGIDCIQIESYGQGETAETLQHSEKKPEVLLEFLDRFCSFGTLQSDENELADKLLENQSEIERLSLEVRQIEDVKRALKNAENQLATLKQKDAAKIVEFEEKLAAENHFKKEVVQKLNALVSTLKTALSDSEAIDYVLEQDESSLVVGKAEFGKVKKIVEGLSNTIQKKSGEINADVAAAAQKIQAELNNWKDKEAKITEKIDKIRTELSQKGVQLDLAFIKKVTNDVPTYRTKLADLTKKQKLLVDLKKDRKKLVADRHSTSRKIFEIRSAIANELNKNLKATIDEFIVHIKYHEGALSREFAELLKEENGWRTSQVSKAELISKNVHVKDFLVMIRDQDSSKLLDISDADGRNILNKKEADEILTTMNRADIIFKLERCKFDDLPEITVGKNIVKDGDKTFVKRDFSKLSLGQQQAILLTTLLYSKNKYPLLIDQPEDNLDSEFIYKTLVKNLKRIKEHRQVIVVTHNANIAVLGDAELIVPLRSTSDRSYIMERGSIDRPETKKITCSILEGSERAFLRRKEIYGY